MSFDSKIPQNTNQVKNLLSTSIVSGCAVTMSNISGGTADATVSKGVVRFVDNHTNAELPNFKGDKSFPETLTNIDITVTRKLVINEDLTVSFPVFTGNDDAEERRDRVQLGVIAANAGVFIPTVATLGYDTQAILRDHGAAYGAVRVDGLRIENNGANLGFKRTAGVEFDPKYLQYFTNTKSPLLSDLPEKAPVNHFLAWQDGVGGFNRSFGNTVLIPGVFDDGTGGVSGPSGTVNNNEAQILRVYEVGQNFGVLYGQVKYNSISAAVIAIATETFIQFDNLIDTSFRGYIVVRGGAVDLSLTADAMLFNPATDFVTVRS